MKIDPKYFLLENFLRHPLGTLLTGSEWQYTQGTLSIVFDAERNKNVGRFNAPVSQPNTLKFIPINSSVYSTTNSSYFPDMIFDLLIESYPSPRLPIIIFDHFNTPTINMRINANGDLCNYLNAVIVPGAFATLNEYHTIQVGFNTQFTFRLKFDGRDYGIQSNGYGTALSGFKYIQFSGDPGVPNVIYNVKMDNFYVTIPNYGLRVNNWTVPGNGAIITPTGSYQINPFGGYCQVGFSYRLQSLESITTPGTYQIFDNRGDAVHFDYPGTVPFPFTVHKYTISAIGNEFGPIGIGVRDYVYHNWTGTLSQIARKNSGVSNWVATASPPSGQRVLFLFRDPNSTTLIVNCVTFNGSASPVTALNIYGYNDVLDTWTLRGTLAINQTINTGAGVNYGLMFTGYFAQFKSLGNSYYYFGIGNGNNFQMIEIFIPGGGGVFTFASQFTITGLRPVDDNTCFMSVPRIAGGGINWQVNRRIKFTLWDGTNYYQIAIPNFDGIMSVVTKNITNDNRKYLFNTFILNRNFSGINNEVRVVLYPTENLVKIPQPWGELNPGDTVYPDINGIFKNLIYGYLYPAIDENISATFELRAEATGMPSQVQIYLNPEDVPFYREGHFYEFTDGFGIVPFIGRVLNPKSTTEKSSTNINFVGLDYEALQKWDKDNAGPRLLANQAGLNSKFHLESIIPLFTYINIKKNIYQSNSDSIDPLLDFNLVYYRNFQNPFTTIITFMRNFEHAIAYFTPDATLFVHKYTRIIPSKIRWTFGHPQVTLISFDILDMRISRSECTGAKNKQNQVRYVYIGNPAIEGSEGISIITVQDTQVLNHNDAVRFATNRFNIYTNVPVGTGKSYFIKLRVKSQGFIQPGLSIDFEWNDGIRIIPRNNYLLIKVDPIDLINDIADIWLTDNIVTFNEFSDVQKSIGRDQDVAGTMYDGSKESTVQGTPTQQNSLGRVRAGTFEERIPEATAFDFTRTALTTAPGWSTLNLSAIIPSGVRAVHIQVSYRSSSAAAFFLFRKFGNTGSFNGVGHSVQQTGQPLQAYVSSAVSEDRKIDVFSSITQANWTTFDFVIVGWDI